MMISDVKHLFRLAILMSSLEKSLVLPFKKLDCLSFFIIYISSLYIMILIPYNMAKIFLPVCKLSFNFIIKRKHAGGRV